MQRSLHSYQILPVRIDSKILAKSYIKVYDMS